MIRRLTGTVVEVSDITAIIDVRGIGYLVASPHASSNLERNQTVSLYTHLVVRETVLDLYGFVSESELEMFEILLGVPKVGPKSALQILGQATPHLLREAAEKNDPAYLQKLSGIGKKTSENIVQYLQQKLDMLIITAEQDTTELNQTQTDAMDALIALGYEATAARNVIKELANPDSTTNSLVKEALKRL